ncbi:MAG: carboxypeptidase regulatory-like domain-containing protein, partial [Bdellovibrionales bacterium]|nr:carboxypeptidase regulatory-like domain-containing protein [Bdellovibrionales bacterium]
RSHETKQIDLSENERGIIEVHLASDGCMLDGYHVSLVDESRRRVLKTLKSDETGILTFSKVPPGVYTVMVRHKKRKVSMSTTVRVGDVLLSKRELAAE